MDVIKAITSERTPEQNPTCQHQEQGKLPHRAALSRISRAEALGVTSSVRFELTPKSRIGELIHRECMS